MKKLSLLKVGAIILLLFIYPCVCFAQTIYLKSGKKIEGKIIEKTDTYIKVDFYGAQLIYFLEDIDRIEEESVVKEVKQVENQNATKDTKEIEVQGTVRDTTGIISSDEGLIRSVLGLSGVELQIKQFSDMVLEGAMQSQGRLDEAGRAKLISIIKGAYSVDKMYPNVVSVFKKNFNKDYLYATLSAFRTPLFEKIIQLEKESASPLATEKIRIFFEQLKTQPPSEDRVALLKEVNSVTHLGELMLKMNLATIRELIQVNFSALPSGSIPKEMDADSLVTALRQQLEPQMETAALNSLLFTYQALTNKEIQDYADFYKTQAGQWFNKLVSEGMLEAGTIAARQTGKELFKIIEETQSLRQQNATIRQ